MLLSLYCFLDHYSLILSFLFLVIKENPSSLSLLFTGIYISEFHVPVPENLFTMSCNGCRILRKGCSDDCMLRQCLQGIDDPQAQANATVFVAKFFGRAGLISFISSVPVHQRPCKSQYKYITS